MSASKYDLHQLGWHGFQQLCNAVVTTVLGQTVEVFLDGNDAGRDGAFQGTWSPQEGQTFAGRFVIQCKFTARREYKLTLADIADELTKAQQLVEKGQCDIYLLITNAGISGATCAKIESAFLAVGVKDVLIFGATWICEKIEAHSRLRMNVPRLYGLGDLSQIMDERRYKQTQALLSELKPDLAKTVVTDTYRHALHALQTRGFVLLVGEPAAGKTTIASLLAMCAMDEWKSQVFKLVTPEEVSTHWSTEESSRLIWVDDAFGVTQYESHLVMGWNRILDAVSSMIKRGHRVVMTSRDYIYNQARRDLKRTSFPLFDESQVVIDVKKLSLSEKEQILYNHLKLGDQDRTVLAKLKPFLSAVALNGRFIPETARRLGSQGFTKGLLYTQNGIDDFVVRQETILVDTLSSMDTDSRAALALIYMKEGAVESPVSFSAQEERAIRRLGSTESKCLSALEHLNGSFVQLVDTDASRIWRFKHPTIGDAFALNLAQSPEHLNIFVEGTSIERLMDLVSCGNMDVPKATIIPPALFDNIAKRIFDFISKTTSTIPSYLKYDRFFSFLTVRCSKEFLVKYIQLDVDLLATVVKRFSKAWAGSSFSFARRLFAEDLLPPNHRVAIVSNMMGEALTGDDLSAIHDEDLHEFFHPFELAKFWVDVQSKLETILNVVQSNRVSRYDYDGHPESHVAEFSEDLDLILAAHGNWPGIQAIISDQHNRLDDWIYEITGGLERSEPMRRRENLMPSLAHRHERSIFDDLDS
ncbi:hypothetical protein [Pseudomonas tremae]|uniref:nSTAND3 domain-containing NTPase n=1 Tax=Pseudomonas tremae TaxID=200454 RepID=UPI00042A2C6D|nr:hypothetical protein [Pseudomonas tremae]